MATTATSQVSSFNPILANTTCDSQTGSQEVLVQLPNLFPPFLSTAAVTNPYYEKVKSEREAWVASLLKLDSKGQKKISKASFSLLSALWVPEASEERFKTVVNFAHWIFFFDDRFDEGDLHDDFIGAAQEIFETLVVFENNDALITPEQDPLRHMFQSIWLDIKNSSSLDLQARFKAMMRKFMLGLTKQVYHTSNGTEDTMSVDQYVDCRRDTIAGHITYVLSEWACDIKLPEYVFEHPCIKECEDIIADIGWMQNDMLSIKKDLAYGVDANLVVKLWKQGYAIQEAVDEVATMLYERYQKWDTTTEQILNLGWDQDVLSEVLRLLNHYCLIASGMLEWSFETGRYGLDTAEIRASHLLRVPMNLLKQKE